MVSKLHKWEYIHLQWETKFNLAAFLFSNLDTALLNLGKHKLQLFHFSRKLFRKIFTALIRWKGKNTKNSWPCSSVSLLFDPTQTEPDRKDISYTTQCTSFSGETLFYLLSRRLDNWKTDAPVKITSLLKYINNQMQTAAD